MTSVEAPTAMDFAGTMWTIPSRWGMELTALGDHRTGTVMWVEVDLPRVATAFPGAALRRSIQRVGAVEMAGVKAAVEAEARHPRADAESP